MDDDGINLSVLSGWLDKKNFLGWKSKRYCSLENNQFSVSKANKKTAIDFILTISHDYIIDIDESKGNNEFYLKVPKGRNLVFCADTKEDLVRWVLALKGCSSESPLVSMNSFQIISVIGRGFYGKVMLCQENITGNLLAIKSVHKDTLAKNQKLHTIIQERDILIKINNHPFLASLRCAFQTETKFYLGIEYLPGGDLFYHLSQRQNFLLDEVRIIIAEIALGLYHLHTLGIIYRDLKPENIVFDSEGHVKIIDYGLSKDLHEALFTQTFCGTLAYLAPEMITRQPYTFSIDWWALGILTYELIFGKVPFNNDNESKLIEDILEKEPHFPPKMDRSTRDFITKLLSKNPLKRPGFAQISKDPFFQGISFDDVLEKKVKPVFKPPYKDPSTAQEGKKETTIDLKQARYINVDQQYLQENPFDSYIEYSPPFDTNFPGFAYLAPLHREDSSDDVVVSDSPQNLSDYMDISEDAIGSESTPIRLSDSLETLS